MVTSLYAFLAYVALAGAIPALWPRLVQELNEEATADAHQRDDTAVRAFSDVQIRTSDGKCLFVDKLSGDFRANLTPVQIAECGATDGQGWDVVTSGRHNDRDGAILVVSTLTQACLNLDPRRPAGDQVNLFSCGGRADGEGEVTDSQLFAHEDGSNNLPLVPLNDESQCLTASGARVDVAACNKGDVSQLFSFGGNPGAEPGAGNFTTTISAARETATTQPNNGNPVIKARHWSSGDFMDALRRGGFTGRFGQGSGRDGSRGDNDRNGGGNGDGQDSSSSIAAPSSANSGFGHANPSLVPATSVITNPADRAPSATGTRDGGGGINRNPDASSSDAVSGSSSADAVPTPSGSGFGSANPSLVPATSVITNPADMAPSPSATAGRSDSGIARDPASSSSVIVPSSASSSSSNSLSSSVIVPSSVSSSAGAGSSSADGSFGSANPSLVPATSVITNPADVKPSATARDPASSSEAAQSSSYAREASSASAVRGTQGSADASLVPATSVITNPADIKPTASSTEGPGTQSTADSQREGAQPSQCSAAERVVTVTVHDGAAPTSVAAGSSSSSAQQNKQPATTTSTGPAVSPTAGDSSGDAIPNPTTPVPVSRAGGTLNPSAAAESQERDDGATRAFTAVSVRAADGRCLFVDPTAGDFRQNLIPVAARACTGADNEKFDLVTSGKHNDQAGTALLVSSLTNGCVSFDGRRQAGDRVTLFSCGGRAAGEGLTNTGQLVPFVEGETSLALAPVSEEGRTCLVVNAEGRLDGTECTGSGQEFTIVV